MRQRNVNSIVCLTEESVETLFLLKREDLIKGVSVYAKRPPEAQKLTKVSSFIKVNVKKVLDIKPDLVIGFSDIQKDIAKELIGEGVDVLITNQRSIEDILDWIYRLSLLIDEKEKGFQLIQRFEKTVDNAKKKGGKFSFKPRFYFEEWDEPMIASIRWVSELIEICGGVNVFANQSKSSLASDRIIESQEVIDANPDVIFACWCGKKVNLDSICNRDGWKNIDAIKKSRVFELSPEVFLQPGPALFLDGFKEILDIFESLQV